METQTRELNIWQRQSVFGKLLLIAACVIIFCIIRNGQKEEEEATARTESLIKSLPPLIVSVDQLKREYAANEVRADNDYKGKVLSVAGVVASVGKDIAGSPYVVIGRGKNELFGVQAMIDNETAERLNVGQQITIVGTLSGKVGNIIMRDCKVE